MTEAELAAIKARHEITTPGPWHAEWNRNRLAMLLRTPGRLRAFGMFDFGDHATNIPNFGTRKQCEIDAAFIAAARTDVPALVAEVERLRAELAQHQISTPLTGG